jgi:methyltransferase
MTAIGIAILALVTVQRLVELWLSNRNTRRLLEQGGIEHGAGHYPLLVAVHVLWLACLWVLAPGRSVNLWWLAVYLVLQGGRIWVLATLGRRWTTRIIVLPDAPLVQAGPYRFLNHPNYAVVIAEIAALPLVFGLWQIALVFTLLNGAILTVRIRVENEALGNRRPPSN